MLTTRIEERGESREVSRPSYKWDAGVLGSVVGPIAAGMQETVVATGMQVLNEAGARSRAWVNKEKPLTREEFESSPYADSMEFEEGLYPEILDIRSNYRVNQRVNATLSEDNAWYGNLAGGLLGSTFGDAPLMLIPAGLLTKGAKATSSVLKSGTSVAKSTALEAALLAGHVKGVRRLAAKELFAKASAEQFAENSAIYWGSQLTERDYGLTDFALDSAVGPFLATGLGIPAIVRTKRIAKINQGLLADKASMDAAVTTADVGSIARILEKNSKEFGVAATGRKDVMDAMELPILELGKPENAHHREVLVNFITENEDALWF